MAFEYAWLKILQVLAAKSRPVGLDELRAELARRGFPVAGQELERGLDRLRAEGLVEALVLTGGELEAIASVAITAKGERKVRGIVSL